MPCHDGREREDEIALLNKVDKLTEMLRFMCQLHWPVDLNERDRALQLECANWWKAHIESGGHMKGPRFTIDELKEALAAMEKR